MSTQVKTPPHRKNLDWYGVKFRLASTLTNDAYVHRTSFARAGKEIDELLQACWPMLNPSPLELLLKRNEAVREFVTATVMPAALNLKALIELGLRDFKAGENEGDGLRSVRRRLRRGESVSPLTIVEAILATKENPGPLLLLDFACFFQLSGDEVRAKRYADAAFEKAPASERERLRARAANDPMLKSVPGVAVPAKRRCQWPMRDPEEPKKPVRTWF